MYHVAHPLQKSQWNSKPHNFSTNHAAASLSPKDSQMSRMIQSQSQNPSKGCRSSCYAYINNVSRKIRLKM